MSAEVATAAASGGDDGKRDQPKDKDNDSDWSYNAGDSGTSDSERAWLQRDDGSAYDDGIYSDIQLEEETLEQLNESFRKQKLLPKGKKQADKRARLVQTIKEKRSDIRKLNDELGKFVLGRRNLRRKRLGRKPRIKDY
jgi:hypothetical protein